MKSGCDRGAGVPVAVAPGNGLLPRLRSILVYPSSYIARTWHVGKGGRTITEGEQARGGESWPHGTVVLAWDGAIAGAVELNKKPEPGPSRVCASTRSGRWNCRRHPAPRRIKLVANAPPLSNVGQGFE